MSDSKSRLSKTIHKYVINVPISIEHARNIDSKNGDTFWGDAIKKKVFNVGVAFEVVGVNDSTRLGCNNVSGHLVFDVTM